MSDPLRFIASIPRLWNDGATWLSELRRLEGMGFHTVGVSHHITHGWQLGLIVAMAFAAASTSRLRVLSLKDFLSGSPAVLVGTAADCGEKLL
jgi:alkanesulfonate monooxygenase SsuD/methylene tetrahydromethanopterin reductase-like flavin-dependent oxidoreductase (luciferase family)